MVNPCLLLAGLLSASPPAETVMPGIRGDTSDSAAPGNYGGESKTAE